MVWKADWLVGWFLFPSFPFIFEKLKQAHHGAVFCQSSVEILDISIH